MSDVYVLMDSSDEAETKVVTLFTASQQQITAMQFLLDALGLEEVSIVSPEAAAEGNNLEK